MLEQIDPSGAFSVKGRRLLGRRVRAVIELDEKKRIIQEFVPGKQVTLCHVIASPDETLYSKLGLLDARGAIGIMTITPSEGAMIAADVATKSGAVEVGFVDRFNGSLVITGDVAAVEAALRGVMRVLCDMMGFSPAPMTKT
ncbi:MAG TPA: BMC domain-containing protein [Candidatus Intestinimonas stercorigallinarum]|nr:BMC domain-containing protein [Candidatus Intestinimonas stercorigallinarum]